MQINKLKSAAKEQNKNKIKNNKEKFQSDELSSEMLLTISQKTTTRNAIPKNMSTGKAQITKIIQFAGYSGFL